MLFGLALVSCMILFSAAADEDGCSKLRHCNKIITECSSNFMDLITDEKVLNAVCKKLPKVRDCISVHEKSCSEEHVRYDAKALEDILEYMCTGAARRLIEILSSSQCADDLLSLEVAVLDCIHNFELSLQADALSLANSEQKLDPSDFCPYVDDLDHCLIHGSYSLCGEDWGTFVADVWRIFSRDEMSQFGCTNRHIRLRRSVSMALSMLSRN